MNKLRPYQEELIKKSIRSLHNMRNVLIVQPTGSGKTTEINVIANFILDYPSSGISKVLILTPQRTIKAGFVDEGRWYSDKLGWMNDGVLFTNNDKKLLNDKNLKSWLCGKGSGIKIYCNQSITNINSKAFDVFSSIRDCGNILLIIDEAHHLGDDTKLREVAQIAINKGARCILATATPFTSKGDITFINDPSNRFDKHIRCLSQHMLEEYCPSLEESIRDFNIDYRSSKSILQQKAEKFVLEYIKDGKPKALLVLPVVDSGSTEDVADEIIALCNAIDPTIKYLNSIGDNKSKQVIDECNGVTYHDVIVTCTSGRYNEGTDDKKLCALYSFANISSPIIRIQMRGRLLRSKKEIINYTHQEYINKSIVVMFKSTENVSDEFSRDALRYIITCEDPFAIMNIPPIMDKKKIIREKINKSISEGDLDTACALEEVETMLDESLLLIESPVFADEKLQLAHNTNENITLLDSINKYSDDADFINILKAKSIIDNVDKIDIEETILKIKQCRKHNTKYTPIDLQFEILVSRYSNEAVCNYTTTYDGNSLSLWNNRWGLKVTKKSLFNDNIVNLLEHRRIYNKYPVPGTDLDIFRTHLTYAKLLSKYSNEYYYDIDSENIINTYGFTDVFNVVDSDYLRLSNFEILCKFIESTQRIPSMMDYSERKIKNIFLTYTKNPKPLKFAKLILSGHNIPEEIHEHFKHL